MTELLLGKVTHYFREVSKAQIEIKEPLFVGDRIHISGQTTDLEQTVDSLEIEQQEFRSAIPGDDVTISVNRPVRRNDNIYLKPHTDRESLMLEKKGVGLKKTGRRPRLAI